MAPKTGLDISEKRRISYFCWDSNYGPSTMTEVVSVTLKTNFVQAHKNNAKSYM